MDKTAEDTKVEARLADELMRFFRLGARAKGMLNSGDLGAEFSALMLLFPLRFLGPMRVTDLAEAKQADPSTVSRQAAQLVKAGLVRREADPEDEHRPPRACGSQGGRRTRADPRPGRRGRRGSGTVGLGSGGSAG